MESPILRRHALIALAASIVLAASIQASARSAGPQADTTAVIDGLMWTVETNGENLNWEGAGEYCRDLRLDNHADWRLPTIEELQSVYEPGAPGYVKSPIRLETCCTWSSTILEEDGDARRALDVTSYAWGFYFPNGDRYYSAMGFTDGQVLCVRPT